MAVERRTVRRRLRQLLQQTMLRRLRKPLSRTLNAIPFDTPTLPSPLNAKILLSDTFSGMTFCRCVSRGCTHAISLGKEKQSPCFCKKKKKQRHSEEIPRAASVSSAFFVSFFAFLAYPFSFASL